jgi:hypothetical protein
MVELVELVVVSHLELIGETLQVGARCADPLRNRKQIALARV